ncbi:MAG: hypothetical protein WC438_02860 [Candidatus Pacearchaeota archaeon]
MNIKNVVICVILVVVLGLIISGCSVGVYGGMDADLYYSDNNAVTGKPLGDPWKSRGSGKNRSTSTEPKCGFEVFQPENPSK